MKQTSSKELQEQGHLGPEHPPIITEGTRPAPDLADRGAGPCHQPSDAAALTGENGGGTSGNHGNGTAG
jgi:hypothetical protein